jgi:O-methyltransferase involved in polyketide biosynthesis
LRVITIYVYKLNSHIVTQSSYDLALLLITPEFRFLAQRGFSQIRNVTSVNYKKAYFGGVNKNRVVYGLLSFAHAVVE